MAEKRENKVPKTLTEEEVLAAMKKKEEESKSQ